MFNGERSSALTIGPIDTKIYMMINSLMYALVPRHDTFYMSWDINFQLGGQWDPPPLI